MPLPSADVPLDEAWPETFIPRSIRSDGSSLIDYCVASVGGPMSPSPSVATAGRQDARRRPRRCDPRSSGSAAAALLGTAARISIAVSRAPRAAAASGLRDWSDSCGADRAGPARPRDRQRRRAPASDRFARRSPAGPAAHRRADLAGPPRRRERRGLPRRTPRPRVPNRCQPRGVRARDPRLNRGRPVGLAQDKHSSPCSFMPICRTGH